MKRSVEDFYGFNVLFSLMGAVLLGVASWIGLNVSHIPLIEQKLDLYQTASDKQLRDHEDRLRVMEQHLDQTNKRERL